NRRALRGRDAVLHRVLHLREGAHLDLAYALARDAEFLRQLHQRDRSRGEPTMRRSRVLSTVSTSDSVLRRLSNSSLAASVVSWSGDSSTRLSWHPPGSPSPRIAGVSQA